MPLQISRILHAGYVFESGGTRIAFDPIFENPFSRNCYAFPDVRFDHERIRQVHFDAIFISHFHDDHCSFDSLDLIDRATPVYLYCLFDELFDMLRQLGFTRVEQLRINETVHIGAVQVTPREALDADVDTMFHIQAEGMHVLNVVDSWIDPRALPILSDFAPWDMVLWPFQTMRELAVLSPSRAEIAADSLPQEWIEQLQVLHPRFVVPSSCQFLQESWSWYNGAFFPVSYRQFEREIAAALPSARVVRLDPSVSVLLDANGITHAAPLDWVLPLGEQDVDYAYNPAAKPPPTAEIARHFPALTGQQAARVRDFCTGGLLEKYRAMELPDESFFARPRVWQLSVYDEQGAPATYRYRIEGDAIDFIAGGSQALSWTTEIPASRLYAALELGETLSSMYMRINDARFDAATEAEIMEADVIDDPLIRCLFNDVFGAYQAAQLARLMARS